MYNEQNIDCMSDLEKAFICQHRGDDVTTLLLQKERYADVDVQKMAVQISAWQTACKKLPLWAATDGICYPVHLSMEQCSSQAAGAYKGRLAARLLEGVEQPLVMDLTGGFGVDCTMMMRHLQRGRLIYVERNEELCALARHNLPLLGVERADVVQGNGEQQLDRVGHADLVFADPARRDAHGGKTVRIADCTPDVTELVPRMARRGGLMMVKLSPMLSISDARQQLAVEGYGVSEVHVVSIEGECKELLLVLSDTNGCRTFCVNIAHGSTQEFVFTEAEEREAVCEYASRPERYLYEPNASLLKGGAYKSLAARLGLRKLHPNSHLYTSEVWCEAFPGRAFEISDYASFNKKELKHLLAGLKKANLTVRNFPMTVADLRKRLKLGEGGMDYLFATTLADEAHVLLRCRKTS